MKSKGRIAGGSGGGGIVIEATNRKARRKEQRHAKKKQKQPTKRKTVDPSLTSSSSRGSTYIANKKQKKDDTREGISSNNNDDKRVQFSNTVQEKTIPSVKNHIPIGLKKKKSSTLAQESDDDEYEQSTTLSTNSKSSNRYYQNLDIETATALHADDVEIEYLESNLGIKKSSKKKKMNSISQELNKEYAKNEGFGDDFGTFLLGLDSLVDRCMGGGKDDDDDDDADAESGSEDNNDESENGDSNSESEEGSDGKMNNDSESDSNESQSMEDTNQDPYANFDEETALALRNDDAEIAALETKLGLSTSSKARKKLNKEFASTFMGYGEDFGDFLNDLDKLGDKVGTDNNRGQRKEGYESMEESDDSFSNARETYTGSDDGSSSNEESGSESDEDDNDEPVDTADHDESLTYRPTSGEDIYGNKIDSTNIDGKKPTKYIPPHLRKTLDQSTTIDDTNDSSKSQAAISAADPETIQHIQRQLNNILNRLSNQTLESVSKSLSKLYATYPFHDVNECLWKNIQNACIPPHMIMSGLIPLYIGAMAGVHWLGGDGIQLGGNLVEWSVVRLFDSLTKGRQSKPNNLELEEEEDGQQQQHDMINKEASNLLLIVCYLYNYGVIHCTLIYDLVRDFIKNFTEIDVESLLLILSHCGQQLRSDDPSSLREIVLLVKERAQKAAVHNDGNVADSSRIQYMVDTIIELKNNKPRKQDALLREKTNAIKKCIGRVKTSASQLLAGKKSGSCLRVTLQDILDAETKGRWWLVGASWAGNQYHDKLWGGEDEGDGDEDGQVESTKPSKKKQSSRKNESEDSLLALASSQRMNTDARRSIFCIIMGSTDCNDAFEKLVRSGMLKPKVERDVIRVIVHCCGEEKAYNPYYAYLAIRCCEYQAKSKFTLMLTFWDAFKLIDGYNIRKVANLAKLLAHLIGASNKCLTIGVLKRIEFSPSNMSEMIIVFLSIFMTTLFESCDDALGIQEIFAHGINTLGDAPPAGKTRVVDSNSDDDDSGKALHQTTKKEDLSDLRESLSIFLLQYLQDSPHNIEGSKWNANLQAAISTCEKDGN